MYSNLTCVGGLSRFESTLTCCRNGLWQHRDVKVVAVYVAFGYLLMEVLFFGVWCRPFYNYWSVPSHSCKRPTASAMVTKRTLTMSTQSRSVRYVPQPSHRQHRVQCLLRCPHDTHTHPYPPPHNPSSTQESRPCRPVLARRIRHNLRSSLEVVQLHLPIWAGLGLLVRQGGQHGGYRGEHAALLAAHPTNV